MLMFKKSYGNRSALSLFLVSFRMVMLKKFLITGIYFLTVGEGIRP